MKVSGKEMRHEHHIKRHEIRISFNANSYFGRDRRVKKNHTAVQLGFMGIIFCQPLLKILVSLCPNYKTWIRNTAPELGHSMTKFSQTLPNCKPGKDQIMSLSLEVAWLKPKLSTMSELGF